MRIDITSTKEAAESEHLKQSNETNTNFRSSKENIIIQVGNHLAIAFKKGNRSIKSNKNRETENIKMEKEANGKMNSRQTKKFKNRFIFRKK